MAFKMKRSGVQLRSTTRVAPELTKFQSSSSPLHQVTIGGKGEEVVNYDNILAGSDPSFQEEKPSSNDACADPNSAACKKYLEHKKTVENDPCYQYTRSDNPITCDPGYTLNPNPTKGDRGSCCVKEGSDPIEENEIGEYSMPGQGKTPKSHILNPREMRRNMRMMRIGSDGDERLIKKANRNIRQAIRRGQSPSENDLAIISGVALGNYDGINIKQDSSGYRDWFTGQVYKSVQTNPGGEERGDINMNQRLREISQQLAQEGDYSGEGAAARLKKDAMAQIKKEARQNVLNSDDRYAEGKYLDSRTRRTMDRYDLENQERFGDYGKKGRSQKKRDRDARYVTKYKDELKSAATPDSDGNYKYNPDNEAGISRKKYDKLKRKTKKRRGDASAFKKKETPIKMTVQLTKPSYKMKGFGK
tara:strand:+ start:2400 stop:3653 length:1254 start_codon:yes stop_codon:yes gene_type:complete